MGPDFAGRVRSGVVNGVEVWLAYGVAEHFLCLALPLLGKQYDVIPRGQWRITLLFFIAYAFAGLLLGAATAIFIDRRGRLEMAEFNRRSRLILIGSLALALALNLVLVRPAGVWASLLALATIGASMFWAASRPKSSRFSFPDAPNIPSIWVAALVAGAWEMSTRWSTLSPFVAMPIAVVASLCLAAAAAFSVRLISKIRPNRFWAGGLIAGLAVLSVAMVAFAPSMSSSGESEVKNAGSRAQLPGDRPNIILVTLDTVRADHLGIYGYSRQNTPNLSALLKDATLYSHTVAAAPITLTSHASIFTGLLPHSHGAFRELPNYPNGRPLQEGIPTAASILGAAGYHTMAVGANQYYLRAEDFGLVRDFNSSWVPRPSVVIEASRDCLLRNGLRRLFAASGIGRAFDGMAQDCDRYSITAATVNARAFALLSAARLRQTPFFLFLNYMDAHMPYVPPPPFDTMYPGEDFHFRSWQFDQFTSEINHNERAILPRERDHLVSQYDGAIACMDSQLGELIQYLKRNGQYDRSLIIVTADHGESLGEWGRVSHNISIYQNQIAIPLIVKFPQQAARPPGVVSTLVGHIDLLPTILEVAGLPLRPELPGRSLLAAGIDAPRIVISERYMTVPATAGGGLKTRLQSAVFQGPLKLITKPNGNPELYDLSVDRDEHNNLYRSDSSPATALTAELERRFRTTPQRYSSAPPSNREELQHLKSLGYVGQ